MTLSGDEARNNGTKVEYLFLQHAPRLLEVAGLTPSEWQSLEEKFDVRMSVLKQRIEVSETESAVSPVNLVDLAFRAEPAASQGLSSTHAKFLSFVESLAGGLATTLPKSLLPTFRLQMRDLFWNFGAESSRYLDKVGELAAARYLSASGAWRIDELEPEISPAIKSRADFALQGLDGSRSVVEVLNVHIDTAKVRNSAGLKEFLNYRAARKLQAKLGLETTEEIAGRELPLVLMLVLWPRPNGLELFQTHWTMLRDRTYRSEWPSIGVLQVGTQEGPVGWQVNSVANFAAHWRWPAPP